MPVVVIIFFAIVVVVWGWWTFKGKRNLQRRLKYDAEQRRKKIDEEDRSWREKQDAKRR